MTILCPARSRVEVIDPPLDLWPHQLLWHGDPEAFATFSVRVPHGEPGPWLGKRSWREWREQSCRMDRLDTWRPNNEPHLRRDAYTSINRFYQPRRSLDTLIRLSANFVDIDCGRSAGDCSAEEAAEQILDFVSLGHLPRPSMFQFSGRGLWAFWLLWDENDSGRSPFADGCNQELWRAIQNRAADIIVTSFPMLPIDRKSLDAAHMTRLNGSMNPKSGQRVRYELLPDLDGEPIRYTLEDLARFYGLPIPLRDVRELLPEERRDLALEEHRRRQDERQAAHERRVAGREGVDTSLSAYGRRGHIALWQGRLRFLDRVRTELYGGLIPHGHRFHMLTAYAYCYARLTKDLAALEAKVFEIALRCCEEAPGDPIRDHDLRGIVKHAREWANAGYQITNRKLAEFAGLDPLVDRELIERLGLNLSIGLKGRRSAPRRAGRWPVKFLKPLSSGANGLRAPGNWPRHSPRRGARQGMRLRQPSSRSFSAKQGPWRAPRRPVWRRGRPFPYKSPERGQSPMQEPPPPLQAKCWTPPWRRIRIAPRRVSGNPGVRTAGKEATGRLPRRLRERLRGRLEQVERGPSAGRGDRLAIRERRAGDR